MLSSTSLQYSFKPNFAIYVAVFGIFKFSLCYRKTDHTCLPCIEKIQEFDYTMDSSMKLRHLKTHDICK